MRRLAGVEHEVAPDAGARFIEVVVGVEKCLLVLE
jgi:hypothetical protein